MNGVEHLEDLIKLAATAIKTADTILISAGAGIGVDSGLPDFRGDEGFWQSYPLLKEENISFMDLANPAWFYNDPARAWGFYGHRYQLYQPHQGFQILKQWCDEKTHPSFIFTSNVDGHFEKSGFDSKSIYECHGSINYLQCLDNCESKIWPAMNLNLTINKNNLKIIGDGPKCPDCGEVARPNILMFGDPDWNSARTKAQGIKFQNWKNKCANKNVVIIELGAGKAIPTARYVSEATVGTLIRINPRDSDGPEGTISLPMGSLDALKKIDKLLKNK